MDFDKVLEQFGVLGFIAVLAAFALYQRFNSRTKVDEAQALKKIEGEDDETHENKLDLETRELTNKLAFKAFDIQEKYQRLQLEYSQQSEVVNTQAENIRRLGQDLATCREVAVQEYRQQVDLLLAQLGDRDKTIEQQNTLIRQLRIDNQILDTFRDIDKGQSK